MGRGREADCRTRRFKEHGRWAVDTNAYYSSTAARYLEVATLPSSVSLDDERRAVANAFKIAAATGRIVILPAFNCHGCSVSGLGGRCARARMPIFIRVCRHMHIRV